MTTLRRHAIAADHIFDSHTLHRHKALLIDGEMIAGILPVSELDRAISVRALPPGSWLAPGFIDTQVNGGGDVLFNAEPTAAPAPQECS